MHLLVVVPVWKTFVKFEEIINLKHHDMKNISLLTVLLFFAIVTFSQQITRGPEIGEIYFMGPTATVMYDAIYRSTDFGETSICVDSVSALSNTIVAITADKTSGSLYFSTMGGGLYYSGSYGNSNTWQLHQGGISNKLCSGRNEGEIYNAIGSHSIDYGINFTNHSLQGYFGSLKTVDIDTENEIGYCISNSYEVIDTLYFFISYDNFNNMAVKSRFNYMDGEHVQLSRENNSGYLFLYNANRKSLLFSENYGEDWVSKNIFACPNIPISGISGGNQDGELYILVIYLQMMGQRRHVYIYHSLDYGETFTVFHPVSIGPDPIYANFMAEDTLVEPGDTVQFTDLSNDAETWEWDFDNDGTIDSYEQNPIYIYQDTGYYTVKLSITGEVIQDYGIRYDYIHVDDLTNVENNLNNESDIKIYPVPADNNFTIETKKRISNISIYNSMGEIIKKLNCNNTQLKENILSISTSDFDIGIYFIKIENPDYSLTKKIIINH